jgi:phosphoglucosamine mutase
MVKHKMKFFGTDGIRGNSSKFPFDNVTLRIIGISIIEVFDNIKPVLIIRDTRKSGERIQKNIAFGIVDMGAIPIFYGIMPTSSASLFLKEGIYSVAIVISASHNKYTDNGIKIFNSNGMKINDLIEIEIEKKINNKLNIINNNIIDIYKPIKKIFIIKKKINIYKNFILKNFSGKNLNGKKIVLDCANGVSYKYAPNILKKLGANVIALNTNPNGKNINLNCGVLFPKKTIDAVKKHKAFCGFIFDGDADRLICVDENGDVKDGDFFLASMMLWLKKQKKINNVLVTTLMSNTGLITFLKSKNINIIFSDIGDKYIVKSMEKNKAYFGGEQSGHFIFKNILPTGDGMLSAIMMLSALCDTNSKMSVFMNVFEKKPQIVINKTVNVKIPFKKLLYTSKLIEDYKKSLKKYERIIVRYSGTENVVRIIVDGEDYEKIEKIAKNIAYSIEKEIINYV